MNELFIDGQPVPVGSVKDVEFTPEGMKATFTVTDPAIFDLFQAKPKPKPTPFSSDYFKGLIDSYSRPEPYQWSAPYVAPSGFSSVTEAAMRVLQGDPGLRRSEKKVAEATFQTLILTFHGEETEVVWFEGEGLADVLERLALALR